MLFRRVRFLHTIPEREKDAAVEMAEKEAGYDEKHALVMSFAQ